MNLDEVLKKLKENEETKEFVNVISSELSKRNEEAKKYRIEKSEVNKTLQEILEKVGAKNTSEIVKKTESSSNEIKALQEQLSNFTTKFEKQEKEKQKVELQNKIIGKLDKFKIKDKDFMLDSLTALSTVGESGEILVKDKTIDAYLQERIDLDKSIVTGIEQSSKGGGENLYTLKELENLTEEEIKANKEKVDNSLKAL